jgi:hypothetical protein
VKHARGALLTIGAFAGPQEEGTMGVVTAREAAEPGTASE